MRSILQLASASPRRKQILENLKLRFEVHPVDADESLDPALNSHPALYIAQRKAKQAHAQHRGKWILTCDTVVETENTNGPVYLGKARNRNEAQSMLEALSGRKHLVRTGHCLVTPEGQFHTALPETRVQFRELDDRLLDWYLDSNEWTDKAGAYGIQDQGALLIESIEGDYLNVVGLSLIALYGLCKEAGINLLDFTKDLNR